ncbi:MAG TPA: hypothetical protein PKH39_13525 [Woeseiaceae bacterium]|nr:hypothetical protein [Woeseiaceae bacterium]
MRTYLNLACLFAFLGVLLSAIPDSGYANDAEVIFSEEQIKSSIEETAIAVTCFDKPSVRGISIDSHNCANLVQAAKKECWNRVDRLVITYDLTGDEDGKEQYIAISDVFTPCIQAKVFWSFLVEAKRV